MALPTGAYQGQDLANWQAGNKFLPREYYSLSPYRAPTTEEEQVTETFGIPYTNAFTGGGGDGGGGPTFNYQSDRNYQPGGMYERNPLASGALDTMMNAQGEIVPNPRYGSSMGSIRPGYSEFSPLEMSYMSELPQSGQDLSRMEKLNMMARDWKGIDSAYENYRTKGKLGEYAKSGIGMIPWLSQGIGAAANMLGLQMTGDRSDRQRWAVDNAGFGQGTGRDQFGVYTGGKTLMGDTANYKERMEQKVKDIEKFLGAGKKNSTMEAQLKDYKIKLGILNEDEDVKRAVEANKIKNRSRDYFIREEIRKQTGEPGIYGLHDEGTAAEDLKAAATKPTHAGLYTPIHSADPPSGDGGANLGTDTPSGHAGDWGPGAKDGGRIRFFYGGLARLL